MRILIIYLSQIEFNAKKIHDRLAINLRSFEASHKFHCFLGVNFTHTKLKGREQEEK